MRKGLWILALGVSVLAMPVFARADCQDTLINLGQQVDDARQNRDIIALHNTSLALLRALGPCYKKAEADGNLGILFYDEAELEIALSGLAVSEGRESPPEHQDLNDASAKYSDMIRLYNDMVEQAAHLPDPYHARQLESTKQLIIETREAAGI